MLKRLIALVAVATAILVGTARAAPDPTVPHADYQNAELWLCRPDKAADACRVYLDATVIAPSGRTSVERFRPARAPKIDCFFVYPTVSRDPGVQSDFAADNMETDDIQLQFARFGAVCRTFAPIYRQFTLTALRAASAPGVAGASVVQRPAANVGGYADVLDAWTWYLSHESQSRGVVLIGHSQGAGLVARLLAETVDGKPLQARLVSALVIGSPTPFLVAPGKDTGGTLKSIPLCHTEDQTGCVIAYSRFRDTNPPPANSRFAKGSNGLAAACSNPANLRGGPGQPAPYFLARGFLNGSGGEQQPSWANPSPRITTPFVRTPGLITTECRTNGAFNYLSVHVNGDAGDPRTDTLAGEIFRPTGLDWSWGLHLIDVDHSMGDLVRIVGKQGAAWQGSTR